MLLLKLILGLAFCGFLLADPEDDMDKCGQYLDYEGLEEFPDLDDMQILCSSFIKTLDCIDDVLEKYIGVRAADVAETASPDSVVRRGANFLLNLRSLLDDVCTEGSPLNTAIMEHSVCIEPIFEDDHCEQQAVRSYATYKQLEDAVQHEAGDDDDVDDEECMVKAYEMACIATEIHEQCGKSAFETVVQIVKRSSVFKYAICSDRDLENLKTKFVDSLEMENYKKDLFRLAFDFRRRRK